MDSPADIERVALLREPTRRSLYLHVRAAGRPVSRDEAAAATGVSRSLAAFHLDRLAGAGLLDVEYRRMSGRSGRGAGRPAKLYRPSDLRVTVSLPSSRYELAGRLLIRALQGKRAGEAPESAAARAGTQVAGELAAGLDETTRRRGAGRIRAVLAELGFEPVPRGDRLVLRNCPFHELMREHRPVVCPMNRAFVAELAAHLTEGQAVAEPVDHPGVCCVEIRKRGRSGE